LVEIDTNRIITDCERTRSKTKLHKSRCRPAQKSSKRNEDMVGLVSLFVTLLKKNTFKNLHRRV